jgi:hypothetical protein
VKDQLDEIADRHKTTSPTPIALDDLPQMHREWRAWRAVCNELKNFGIDVNAKRCDPLVNAVKRWGEELVALRSKQDPATVARVLEETRAAYPELPNE